MIDYEPIRIQIIRREWEVNDTGDFLTDQNNDFQEDCLKVWLHYFIKLNNFPTKTNFYKRFENADECDFNNNSVWYFCLPYKNAMYKCRLEHTRKFRDAMVWMLCERGCQFYPRVFDEDFQRQALHHIFDKR